MLHQLRQVLRGGEQDRASPKHDQERGAELPCRHHAHVDHRIAAAKLPRNHQHEGQRANRGGGDDEAGRKPIVLETAVERDLERAEEGGDQDEADEVKAAALLQEALALGTRGV